MNNKPNLLYTIAQFLLVAAIVFALVTCINIWADWMVSRTTKVLPNYGIGECYSNVTEFPEADTSSTYVVLKVGTEELLVTRLDAYSIKHQVFTTVSYKKSVFADAYPKQVDCPKINVDKQEKE